MSWPDALARCAGLMLWADVVWYTRNSMRYVLLDRITSLDPPGSATGVKCVSLADDIFVDHFPGHPIMPGALILEGMAQLGGVLIEATMRQRGRSDLHALLVMADRTRFRKMARPGDRLELEAHGIRVSEDGGRVRAVARIDGVLAAEAELGFAFAEVKHPRLIERRRAVLNVWLTGSEVDPDEDPSVSSGPSGPSAPPADEPEGTER